MVRISIWRMTYSDSMNMVRGTYFWMKKGQYIIVTEPQDPTFPGRKKKKTRKKFPRLKGNMNQLRRRRRNYKHLEKTHHALF